ncbi:acyltransferase [Nakamurella silvestris]|nr:acyltransferase [Nakamurella silvestris]
MTAASGKGAVGRARRFARRVFPRFWRDLTLTKVAGSMMIPSWSRWRVLNLFGCTLEQCHLAPGTIVSDTRLTVGRGTFVSYRCFLDTTDRITIGRSCAIAMNVSLVTSSHELGPSAARAGAPVHGPITVGEGVWIGAGATVLPGVTIGSGCVIAAGAVVTTDCAPDGLYAGVPARRARDLELSAPPRSTDTDARSARSSRYPNRPWPSRTG